MFFNLRSEVAMNEVREERLTWLWFPSYTTVVVTVLLVRGVLRPLLVSIFSLLIDSTLDSLFDWIWMVEKKKSISILISSDLIKVQLWRACQVPEWKKGRVKGKERKKEREEQKSQVADWRTETKEREWSREYWKDKMNCFQSQRVVTGWVEWIWIRIWKEKKKKKKKEVIYNLGNKVCNYLDWIQRERETGLLSPSPSFCLLSFTLSLSFAFIHR